MATTTRTRRPSKAAVARARAEIAAEPKQRYLPADLAAVIEKHQPTERQGRPMELIRPFLRAAITASSLTGQESVRKHCTHLTEIARYALTRGVPLTVERVLTTSFIDEFVRIDMAEMGDHQRAERRRRLLKLACSANPGPDVPARLTPLAHSAIKPCYSPIELAVITRVCFVQPTEARRRDLACVVALGAGAGLDSVDMRDLTTTDVEDLGELGLRVHVHGPRPRVVPVRKHCEALLRNAVAGRAPGELLLGQKQDRRNTAARATERAALYNVPHIEPARLRATWLADLMTDPIPLALILQAAGLKSARTLSELLPHLDSWLAHKGLSSDLNDTAATTELRGEQR